MKKTLFLLACLVSLDHVVGWVPSRLVDNTEARSITSVWSSKLFGPDEDFDSGKEEKEGEALAKEFYKQMRKREESEMQLSSKANILSDSDEGQEPPLSKRKKFTGRPNEPLGSEDDSLFAASNRQGPTSPREQMMQREFDLVSNAEKGLGFQAVLAGCILIFYIYVGLTGGIQSSGDEVELGPGADDTIIEELVLPQRRDVEASYWL